MAHTQGVVQGDRGKALPRKRRRLVISCTECHRRKQKCDRGQPCANCRSRNKELACIYETGAPTGKDQHAKKTSPGQASQPSLDGLDAETLSSVAADFGYAHNGASTLGFLKKIETADGDGPETRLSREDDARIREKYKSLVRQLPSKTYIDKLINMYMRGFNWQYYAIAPDVFFRQLEEWYNIPFATLSLTGPTAMRKDMRAFPALLFQVVGTALLILPETPDPTFDALKYAGNMTFEDLARDYSDSGVEILRLFGKSHLSLTTVQVQFLRASFLKFTAKPTEAWHAITVTIRDAQELGLHLDSMDPKPNDSSLESVLENQWEIQERRKMYNLLAVWDINCAMVLGRPGTIDWNQGLPTLPTDTLVPEDRTKVPVNAKTEEQCPTPMARVLWLYELAIPLKYIHNLEAEGSYPKDFSKVDEVHRRILELGQRVPAVFRLDNPDTRWDDHPGMDWMPACRFYFAQLYQFNLMALHRPYVFNRKESRLEALQASIRMLEVQKMTFQGLPPDSWRNFMLFFGSFDAIVLIASVYILFPNEHPEFKASVSQHFQWTIERFSAMQQRNPLAKSAQGVLRAIVSRYRKAVGMSPELSAPIEMSQTPTSESKSTLSSGFTATESPPASSLGINDPYSTSYPQPSITSEWTLPSADSLAGIAPLWPTHDLVFNDLSALSDENDILMPPKMDNPPQFGADCNFAWHFGGDWGNDSVWGFLNHFQPQWGDPTVPGSEPRQISGPPM